jgi:hypothetical protein
MTGGMTRGFRGVSFEQLMVGLLFGALAAAACLMPAQPDTFWHLRAGEEIWTTFHVPLDEHYSFTAAGRVWPNHEWLWQAFSFALVRAGGMRLLTLASAAIAVGAVVILYRLMVGPARARFVLLLLGIPLVPSVWAVRPQLVSLLLLAVLLHVLVHERFVWLPPLFALWANLHGAVALGIAVLCAALAAALLRVRAGDARDRARAVALAVLLPVSALATALTPMGFRLWSYIGSSMAMSRQNRIDEWQPALPRGPFEIGFWLLALGLAALLIWRRRRLAGASWGDVVSVAAALVVLPLAARAVRNVAPFMLLAIPAASRLLGPDFRPRLSLRASPERAAGRVASDRPRLNAALLAAFTLVELAGVSAAWAGPHPRLGWRPMSEAAIEAVRSCPGPLYNRYYDGGYLIWFVPEQRVFVDSRQDPYPPALLLDQIAIEEGGPYRPVFDRYGMRSAFLPAAAPLGARLRADGWHTKYADESWTLLIAPAP